MMLVSFSISPTAFALYVSDTFKADIRTGPSLQHRIISYLQSGTYVETSETSEDEKWVKVSANGVEGWTLSQYLQPTRTANLLLNDANGKIDRLNNSIQTKKDALQSLQRSHDDLVAQNESLQTQLNTLQSNHDQVLFASKNAVETMEKLRALEKEYETLKLQNGQLITENEASKNDKRVEGIRWGIIAVLVGVLLATILPKLTPSKKSSW